MKKLLSVLLAVLLLTTLLAGCGKKEENGTPGGTTGGMGGEASGGNSSGGSEGTSGENTGGGSEGNPGGTGESTGGTTGGNSGGNAASGETEYRLGLGVAVEDGSREGSAQVEATAAVVLTDASGKIVACYLDTAENQMDISAGKVMKGQEYQTKQEKGDGYGMKAASGIGKEWYEQADYFAEYVIGKDAAEVAAIETKEEGGHQRATDADLLAGCTIDISSFIEAVEKACNDDQAKSFQASAKPVLNLAAETEDSDSKDPSDEERGSVQMNTTFGATATIDGKLAAAILDEIQPKIEFSSDGVPTGFVFDGTKRELKEAYGMKTVSGIGKEWYEQANFFTDYVTGKTASEIGAIATEESGGSQRAADADILAGCTVDISGFLSVLTKAMP